MSPDSFVTYLPDRSVANAGTRTAWRPPFDQDVRIFDGGTFARVRSRSWQMNAKLAARSRGVRGRCSW